MNILIVAQYVTIDEIARFSKNRSGFGYMVWTIARELAKEKNDVTLSNETCFGKATVIDGVNIIKSTVLKNISLPSTWKSILFSLKNKALSKSVGITRRIYSYLYANQVIKFIKSSSPQIVHLHGASEFNRYIINELMTDECKIILTLHGLRQDCDNNSVECMMAKTCIDKGWAVSVVSSGIKKYLVKELGIQYEFGIHVILNGVDINNNSHRQSVYMKRFESKRNGYRFLMVGNISRRKNQIQAVRAIKILHAMGSSFSSLRLVGTESDGGNLRRYVQENNLNSIVTIIGHVPRHEMEKYYIESDGIIIASISEGFGLPVCEAFTYGLPCLMFDDLDAVNDVFTESGMLLMKRGDDSDFANAMNGFATKNWNHDEIMTHAERFSLQVMTKEYMQLFGTQL